MYPKDSAQVLRHHTFVALSWQSTYQFASKKGGPEISLKPLHSVKILPTRWHACQCYSCSSAHSFGSVTLSWSPTCISLKLLRGIGSSGQELPSPLKSLSDLCFQRPPASFHPSASSLSNYGSNRGLIAVGCYEVLKREISGWPQTWIWLLPRLHSPVHPVSCLGRWGTWEATLQLPQQQLCCAPLWPPSAVQEKEENICLGWVSWCQDRSLSMDLIFMFFTFEYCVGLFHAQGHLERLLYM